MLSLARQRKIVPRKRHVLPRGFWSKVDRSGGENACWLWLRGLNKGYGTFGRREKRYIAHRVVLQWATQREGNDLYATHGPCHTRACVNPRHLSWKTPKGNQADRLRDGTHNRGQRQGRSKLNEEQVLAIRADSRTYLQIAEDYGVSPANIGFIKTRGSWAWLA